MGQELSAGNLGQGTGDRELGTPSRPTAAIKEGVSWQAQGMVREVQISWRGEGLGGGAHPPHAARIKSLF